MRPILRRFGLSLICCTMMSAPGKLFSALLRLPKTQKIIHYKYCQLQIMQATTKGICFKRYSSSQSSHRQCQSRVVQQQCSSCLSALVSQVKISGLNITCEQSLIGFSLDTRVFIWVLWFSSHLKINTLNSHSICQSLTKFDKSVDPYH